MDQRGWCEMCQRGVEAVMKTDYGAAGSGAAAAAQSWPGWCDVSVGVCGGWYALSGMRTIGRVSESRLPSGGVAEATDFCDGGVRFPPARENEASY